MKRNDKHREKRAEIPVYDHKGESQAHTYYVLASDEDLPKLYHIMDDLFMDREGNYYIVFDDYNG